MGIILQQLSLGKFSNISQQTLKATLQKLPSNSQRQGGQKIPLITLFAGSFTLSSIFFFFHPGLGQNAKQCISDVPLPRLVPQLLLKRPKYVITLQRFILLKCGALYGTLYLIYCMYIYFLCT